jgi:hemolysin-activating ACP:hemolysin acyltransferase
MRFHNFIVFLYCFFYAKHLTDCVTCVWAGVDNAWEQEKLEARKMLVNRAESHTSGARFVGWLCARLAD